MRVIDCHFGINNRLKRIALITRETDYAVRAMIYLAIQEDRTVPVSSSDLAEEMAVPYRFLRKIVLKLVNAKLVNSKRGKGGGLNLAVDPNDVTLYDIMNAVDPVGVRLNICLDDSSRCSRSYFCGLRSKLRGIQAAFDASLKDVTLASIAVGEGVKAG